MLQKSPVLDPSLRNLAYILRHREWWPEGFEWNYQHCSTCAIGLSDKLWGVRPYKLDDGALPELSQSYHDIFADSDTKRTFWDRVFLRELKFHQVTPEQVADQIDEFLSSKGR